MADQTVGVIDQPTGAGVKKVDTSELTVAGATVERQRMVIADPVGAALFANVTAAGALKIDGSAVTQPVSGTFFQATQPVSGAFFQATQPVSGAVSITGAVGVTGTFWQVTQPVSLAATINASPVAKASGGALASRITTGASGVIKGGAGQLYGWALLNTNAAVRYLQFYNKTTAGVPGTDTPVFCIPLAASGAASGEIAVGFACATGISWAITTDAAGATIGASGDLVGTIAYF